MRRHINNHVSLGFLLEAALQRVHNGNIVKGQIIHSYPYSPFSQPRNTPLNTATKYISNKMIPQTSPWKMQASQSPPASTTSPIHPKTFDLHHSWTWHLEPSPNIPQIKLRRFGWRRSWGRWRGSRSRLARTWRALWGRWWFRASCDGFWVAVYACWWLAIWWNFASRREVWVWEGGLEYISEWRCLWVLMVGLLRI
jgi:hypothetical protein